VTDSPTQLPLHPRVRTYVDAVIDKCVADEGGLVSMILFGSAATGGFAGAVSDVDLFVVLPDGAGQESKRRVRDAVTELEILHGFAGDSERKPGALKSLVDKITGSAHSFFVCTQGDLLSGKPALIFGIPAAQAVFVDRIVIPNIVFSAVTVWGEDLLAQIPLPPIRRLDVFKGLFSQFNQALLASELFAVLPGATRYAMAALKHSLHSCFFCYHGRPGTLQEEVEFFQAKLGPSPALEELLGLRREYRESFGFAVRCIPTVVRLYLRAAFGNRFPHPVLKRI
jgi:predicted nucleotidyltransferase